MRPSPQSSAALDRSRQELARVRSAAARAGENAKGEDQGFKSLF
jgi:hypothetical protein